MLKIRSGGSSSSSGKIFNGVRFVLFGFDSVSEAQYRSEIVRRGGFDVGKYDDSCTHAIVSGRVYDDPVCIAARKDGKIVVTELWVDDSVDFGTLADASRIIYRPVKDLGGIPGSESLYICLTGYQRQERDDIMKMVSLMGARFSKPLIANQVTHLICYKFEGEKYELAKKVKIKLVNHRWLVDCLKAWEILPIDNYTKSGWELEVLEAEARDSEEETEDPHTALLGQRRSSEASHSRGEMPVAESSHVDTCNKVMSSIDQETPAAKLSHTADGPVTNQKLFPTPCNVTYTGDALHGKNLNINVEMVNQEAKSTSHSSGGDRKKEVMTSNLCREGLKENTLNGDLDISIDDAETNRELPQKRKDSDLSPASKIPKLGGQESNFSSRSPFRSVGFSQLEHTSASSPSEGVTKTSSKDDQHVAPSKLKSVSYRRSLKRGGQPTQSNFSKSAVSPTVGSAHDGYPRDALDQPSGVKNELPVSETKDSCAIISPSSSTVLRGKPCDDEPKKAMDVHGIVEKIAIEPSDDEPKKAMDVDGSVEKIAIEPFDDEPKAATEVDGRVKKMAIGLDRKVVDSRNKEMKTQKNVSKTEMVSNAENGDDIVMKDLSKFIADETRQHKRKEQNEETASLHRRDSETKKLRSSASTSECKVIADNKSSALRIKKVGSRRNLSCKSTVNTSKDKPDKFTTPKTTEVKSGKIEKLKARMDVIKASSKDEKKEAVESASKDLIMEDDSVKPKARKKKVAVRVKASVNPEKENKPKGVRVKASVDPENENKPKGVRVMASVDPEKENKPKGNDMPSLNVNSPNKKVDLENSKENSREAAKQIGMESPEPVWFILSGHRFQRKEFQSVIKRLRGRVCRDSHNWSYQATHFIVPGPVRRTEKFFAAAAAGRWILKMDYLTASNEAGKFLEEEPFEWYKKGLTEDGGISLEAPRKWRHLKERTGHGAFHKMRVIVYGECIAPSLDTLKRVVKAGDGAIVATAPPYTRFLETGVDFAIVSAGMPRVDAWVEEFLRHEIPCVAADYLVEYVCKPGYSLDKHVLYGTNSLAERALENLGGRLEDVRCLVCGSGDRGEVMLICGDESGSVGCGVGAHIDCCDPPMEAVPEVDWFCPGCNQDGKSNKRRAKAKKLKL